MTLYLKIAPKTPTTADCGQRLLMLRYFRVPLAFGQ
jgi:hypothetical protein